MMKSSARATRVKNRTTSHSVGWDMAAAALNASGWADARAELLASELSTTNDVVVARWVGRAICVALERKRRRTRGQAARMRVEWWYCYTEGSGD